MAMRPALRSIDPRRHGAAHADDGAGLPPCRRVRRAPLSPRLLAVLAVQASADAVPDDAARAARSAGTGADLRLLSHCATGIDLRCAADPLAGGELCRDGAPRTAGRPADAAADDAALPGIPRTYLSRKAAGPGNSHRPPG